MSVSDARSRLAEQQTNLVRALVCQAEPPPGFDLARLQLAARSLINKRVREVGRACPELLRCLGAGFPERFGAFARGTPPPLEGGPLVDGLAFAKTLDSGELDDSARLEMLFAALHGLRFGFKSGWLPGARRLVLVVWLPWLGARAIELPWRRRLD